MHLFRLTDTQITEISALVERAKSPGHTPTHDGHWRRLQWLIDSWKDAYDLDIPPRFTNVTANDPRISRQRAGAFQTAQREILKAVAALEKIEAQGVSIAVPVSVSDTSLVMDDSSPIDADPLALLGSLLSRYESAQKREKAKDPNPRRKIPAMAREPVISLAIWWREATGTFPTYSKAKDDKPPSFGQFGQLLETLKNGPAIPALEHVFRHNQSSLVDAIKEAKRRYDR
ncbi:hypothetical protein MAALD49_06340 [Marinobacter shengliensis]|nr:hypothetical protein MAALD49_06340 [Marinobacter shengliensis]